MFFHFAFLVIHLHPPTPPFFHFSMFLFIFPLFNIVPFSVFSCFLFLPCFISFLLDLLFFFFSCFFSFLFFHFSIFSCLFCFFLSVIDYFPFFHFSFAPKAPKGGWAAGAVCVMLHRTWQPVMSSGKSGAKSTRGQSRSAWCRLGGNQFRRSCGTCLYLHTEVLSTVLFLMHKAIKLHVWIEFAEASLTCAQVFWLQLLRRLIRSKNWTRHEGPCLGSMAAVVSDLCQAGGLAAGTVAHRLWWCPSLTVDREDTELVCDAREAT